MCNTVKVVNRTHKGSISLNVQSWVRLLEDRNNFRPNTVNQLTASTFIGHENSTNASSAKLYIEVSEMKEEEKNNNNI